jgi:DHA2 family multidrug resistance protein
MLIAGRLTGKIDARLLVGLGIVLMGASLYLMTKFAIVQPSNPVIISGVVQGLGLGLIFVPLQSLAFQTLAPRMRTTGAALLNLSRNIGGSIGISVVSTQLVRMAQVSHADMAMQITQQTIPTADPTILQTILPVAGPAALAYVNGMINKQALFIAYLDDFKLMMIITFAVLPLLFFMKKGQQAGGAGPPAHMD